MIISRKSSFMIISSNNANAALVTGVVAMHRNRGRGTTGSVSDVSFLPIIAQL